MAEHPGVVAEVDRIAFDLGVEGRDVNRCAGGLMSANAGNLVFSGNLGTLCGVEGSSEGAGGGSLRSLLFGLPGVVWDVDARTVVGGGKKRWPRWEKPRVGEDVVGDEGRDWVYDYTKPLDEAYEKLVRVGRSVPGGQW